MLTCLHSLLTGTVGNVSLRTTAMKWKLSKNLEWIYTTRNRLLETKWTHHTTKAWLISALSELFNFTWLSYLDTMRTSQTAKGTCTISNSKMKINQINLLGIPTWITCPRRCFSYQRLPLITKQFKKLHFHFAYLASSTALLRAHFIVQQHNVSGNV